MRPLSKKDKLILRAAEAGFKRFEAEAFIHVLARFEHSVRVDEREACAKVCDKYAEANSESDIMCAAFDHCANAIRARGENK